MASSHFTDSPGLVLSPQDIQTLAARSISIQDVHAMWLEAVSAMLTHSDPIIPKVIVSLQH